MGREKAGVACRLEIIGLCISGQSVIFRVDAAVYRTVDSTYFSEHQNQCYHSGWFHLIRTRAHE